MMQSRLITIWRITVAGTRNFFRNAWLSVASTAVMTVTLSVVLAAIILNFALNDALTQVTKKIDVAIYLEDTTKPAEVTSLSDELKQQSNVTTIHYVDKTEALRRYRAQYQNNPDLLNAINAKDNPLPTSLEVGVKDLNQVQPIIDITTKPQYANIIQDTSFGEDRRKTIERIGNIKHFLLEAGIVAGAIFAVISVLIIFNTIRMAIFSRRDEVEVMRLIGATNGYIRGPFIFEAMLDGVVAAVFALTVGYVLLFVGGPKLLSYIDFSHTIFFFETHWTVVGLLTLVGGMLIGITSSLLALIRYLQL